MCSLLDFSKLVEMACDSNTGILVARNVFTTDRMLDMTVKSFVDRLWKYTKTDMSTMIVCLILMDRLTFNSDVIIQYENFHNVITTCFVLGEKFVSDHVYTNTYYGKIGGLELAELNKMELTAFKLLDYDIFVSPEEFSSMSNSPCLSGIRRERTQNKFK